MAAWILEDVGGREMQLGLAVAACVKDVRSGLEAGQTVLAFSITPLIRAILARYQSC